MKLQTVAEEPENTASTERDERYIWENIKLQKMKYIHKKKTSATWSSLFILSFPLPFQLRDSIHPKQFALTLIPARSHLPSLMIHVIVLPETQYSPNYNQFQRLPQLSFIRAPHTLHLYHIPQAHQQLKPNEFQCCAD